MTGQVTDSERDRKSDRRHENSWPVEDDGGHRHFVRRRLIRKPGGTARQAIVKYTYTLDDPVSIRFARLTPRDLLLSHPFVFPTHHPTKLAADLVPPMAGDGRHVPSQRP